MRFLRLRRRIGEQVTSLLRAVGAWGHNFWSNKSVVNQVVDHELARELYRNSNSQYNLAAGFCRRIIDGTVEFMGMPRCSSDDEDLDDWLNESIQEWWTDEIQQIIRNATRDSKTVVRIAPFDWLDDPLISAEDSDRIRFEVIEPERVRVYYNPFNSEIADQAVITHMIPFLEDDLEDRVQTDPFNEPTETIHEVIEIIDRDRIRYYDKREGEWLDEFEQANTWGFVPVLEIHNEWDETAGRGQSDLEACFPFIVAFHDVMRQSLEAHGYHSVPKVKFKVDDVLTFLKNNWPGSFDEEGNFSGEINWQGKEILFMQSEEDAEFLEAESILGDSKTLLEFLFDCICIASETPGWVLMRTEQGANESAPIAFVKKIIRKRNSFKRNFQKLFKMALVMSGRRPIHVKMAWDTVRPEDEAANMQAFQEKVMGLEVAAQRKIISDQTYRAEIRPFLKSMKGPQQEESDAEDNFTPEIEALGGGNARNGNVPVETRAGSGGKNE
jgi:hypothetical protein